MSTEKVRTPEIWIVTKKLTIMLMFRQKQYIIQYLCNVNIAAI